MWSFLAGGTFAASIQICRVRLNHSGLTSTSWWGSTCENTAPSLHSFFADCDDRWAAWAYSTQDFTFRHGAIPYGSRLPLVANCMTVEPSAQGAGPTLARKITRVCLPLELRNAMQTKPSNVCPHTSSLAIANEFAYRNAQKHIREQRLQV